MPQAGEARAISARDCIVRFISEGACISALRLVIPRRRLLSSDHCRGEITTDIFKPLPFRAHILRRRVIKPGSTEELPHGKSGRKVSFSSFGKSEKSSPALKGFSKIRNRNQSEAASSARKLGRAFLFYLQRIKITLSYKYFSIFDIL